MEKLPIEFLAPYLPFGLQMSIPDNYQFSGIWTSAKLLPLTGIQGDFIKISDIGGFYPIYDFKPLLIPLYKLTDTEIDPSPYFTKIQMIDAIESLQVPYWLMVALIKEHYDVFGQIEKGYAIDKTTVK